VSSLKVSKRNDEIDHSPRETVEEGLVRRGFDLSNRIRGAGRGVVARLGRLFLTPETSKTSNDDP